MKLKQKKINSLKAENTYYVIINKTLNGIIASK